MKHIPWDGKIEPVHERTWHHCPVCGEALNTPKDLLKQGFVMVHGKCLTGESNAE